MSYTDTEWTFACFAHSSNVFMLDICLYQYFLGRDGQTMAVDTLIRRQDDLYNNAVNVKNRFIELKSKLSDIHSSTALIPLMKLLGVYFKIVIICQPSKKETRKSVHELVDFFRIIDYDMKKFYNYYKWKGLKYVKLYEQIGLSVYPIYNIYNKYFIFKK